MEAAAESGNILGTMYLPTDSKISEHASELRDILDLLAEYDWLLADHVRTPIDPSWCTPKVLVFVEIVLGHYTTDFQGIAFVDQRHIAACLARIIPRLPRTNGLLKCAELMGHGSTGVAKSTVKGMPTKFQQDVVQMFRGREVNLCKSFSALCNSYLIYQISVIATSVAEEGLDFPASSFLSSIFSLPTRHRHAILSSVSIH